MSDILLENLFFSYHKTAPVFEHFSASIETGARTALTAPSGKGKTTLLHLIAGLLTPQEGAIRFPKANYRISMVFQENRLIPSISILENIRLVNRRLPDSEILSLLQKSGIEQYAEKKPAHLSGGEQRRAAIVRALAAPYDLLLLDEPFSGLDKEAKKKMIQLIKEKTEDKTVLLVSHNLEDTALLECKKTIQI